MISLTTVLLVGLACVILEGFCSGSEIAFVSANRTLIQKKAREGDRAAKMVEALLAEPERLLATTLIGTNIAVATFSITVALYLFASGHGGSELLTIATVTPVTLILGEVVPKTLFQSRADTLVLRIIYPVRIFSIILRPAVVFASTVASVIARIVGGDRKQAFVTRDELALLIDTPTAEDSEIKEHELEMIANVFELSEATVYDVMVPLSEVTALSEDTTVGEAALEIADKQHSRMPVYSDRVDNVVGVLYAFHLLDVGGKGKSKPISEIMVSPVFVPEHKPAVDLLVELQGTGSQLAIVVDEYGGATGIVTVEDLLEEVVGEIEDEHDDEPSPIVAERAGVWRVSGKVDVERINAELGLELPESDEYESIAGLMLMQFKSIPSPGESVIVGDTTLRVLSSTDRAIENVQILRRKR